MNSDVKTRLLASIDAGRLVTLCGAGLSMAPPSSLPSARRLAELCFDAYQARVDPNIDPRLRQNLEDLAEHFVGLNLLKAQFIDNLVPWHEFVQRPNHGHAAIADFLITRAAVAGLSSNYDQLIERCAWDYGADFIGSLDGDEATLRTRTQAPLLKFHGCSFRDRGSTVWSVSQLSMPVIAERIERSKSWMAANLRQKDFLVVGFWSDWDYLNGIVDGALDGLDPRSVTVVDLSSAADLQSKAPHLWALAHRTNVEFEHIQESGADVLDELRQAFSVNYLRQMLIAGRAAIEGETGAACDPVWLNVIGLDSESLYDWRRDAEGVPSGRPATNNRPRDCETLGYFHLLLRRAGAVQEALGYTLAGQRIRVINGAGSILNSLGARFVEAPVNSVADFFVAVGATDIPVPAHIFRPGTPGSVMRPAARGTWLTFEQARSQLGV